MQWGWGEVMEDIRQAFEVCHALRHWAAFFCLAAIMLIRNGLCVGSSYGGNLSQPSSSARGTCPVDPSPKHIRTGLTLSDEGLFFFEMEKKIKYRPRWLGSR